MLDKLTANRVLLFAVFIMLLALLRPGLDQVPRILQADLPNPDSFYKLVLVREYSPDTGFQYMARDNAPWGAYQHWSAVHSWTLLQVHRFLRFAGVERDQALLWAGSAITAFSMLALSVLIAKLVTAQGSMLAAIVAVIALASSVPLNGYGQLNQITHHVFMLVPLAAAALYLFPPLVRQPKWNLSGIVAGALLALALWISPETMPMVTALLAVRAAHHVQEVGNGPLFPIAAGLLGMLLLAWWLDPPPPTFSEWALDHVSLAWLLFALLLALLLVLVDLLEARNLQLSTRLLITAAATMGAGFMWVHVVPHALQGPEGLIPAELKYEWWDHILELQPVRSATEWIASLFMPVLSGITLLVVAYRNKSLWMAVLAVSLFAYAALAFQHMRMGAAAGMLAATGYGIALARLDAFRNLRTTSLNNRQQLTVVLLMLMPVMQLMLVWVLKKDEAGMAASSQSSTRCRISDIAPWLKSLPAGIALTPINDGPELLWHTSHRIVAGNYHHNVSGLLDHHRIWKSEAPDEHAQQLIGERKIDYVLACGVSKPESIQTSDQRSLVRRMNAGERIAWLAAPQKIGSWWVYRTKR